MYNRRHLLRMAGIGTSDEEFEDLLTEADEKESDEQEKCPCGCDCCGEPRVQGSVVDLEHLRNLIRDEVERAMSGVKQEGRTDPMARYAWNNNEAPEHPRGVGVGFAGPGFRR